MESEKLQHMRAWIFRTHSAAGALPELTLRNDYPRPVLCEGQVLIRVRCFTLNPVDYKLMQGAYKNVPTFLGGPFFDAKEGTIPCCDGQGVVVETNKTSAFSVGDEVVWDNGARGASAAEFVAVDANKVAKKPAKLSSVDSASVGLASGTATTAIEFLFDKAEKAHVVPADKKMRFVVLGGAGGVGASAIVQLKALGHFVYTTCSERNTDFCKRMGADVVIDYRKKPFWEVIEPASVHGIFQAVGTPGDYDNGIKLLVKGCGFASCNATEGFFNAVGRSLFYSAVPYTFFLNKPSTKNLSFCAKLYDENPELPSIVGHVYTFDKFQEAMELSMASKATGKIVVTVD